MNLRIPDRAVIERAIFLKNCQEDFYFFVKEAWEHVEAEQYTDNWHIELCCRHLESVEKGDIHELAMMLPPGHMKSLLTAVFFPAWVWLTRPYTRWIFATYSADFSMRDASKRLKLIRSEWYKNICDIVISRDAVGRVENIQGGFWLATSTGGVGTGERAHYCVNDDLLRMNDADSSAYRKEAITHMEAMSSRGVSQDDYRQIIAAQRLHPDDPIGWALSQGWPYLILPADEPGKSTVLSWEDLRVSGDILFPSRFGREYLEGQKRVLGSRKYEGQYRQNPIIAEGGIIKREWVYNNMYITIPSRFDEIAQSWDCKLGGKSKDSDYVVGQVWGRVGPDKYLIDQVSGQWQFTETRSAMRQMFYKWPATGAKWIEAKAEGSAAASDLSHEFPGIILVNPDQWGGKPLRISAVSVEFEAGNIHLPDPSIASWVGDIVEQLCGFTEEGPGTSHDDSADACSMAILKFRERKGNSFIFGGGFGGIQGYR